MTTGIVRVYDSDFKRRKISKPFTLGSFKSRDDDLEAQGMGALGRNEQEVHGFSPSEQMCKRAPSPAFSRVRLKNATSSGLSSTKRISGVLSDMVVGFCDVEIENGASVWTRHAPKFCHRADAKCVGQWPNRRPCPRIHPPGATVETPEDLPAYCMSNPAPLSLTK